MGLKKEKKKGRSLDIKQYFVAAKNKQLIYWKTEKEGNASLRSF